MKKSQLKNMIKETILKEYEEEGYVTAESLGNDPEKHIPIFMHVIKAPFSEINGKIIGTQTFQDSKDLTKLVSHGYLNLNRDLYDRIEYTKYKKDADYLVKQNPYGMSPKVKKMKKDSDLDNKRVNTNSRYIGDLDTMIAKDINVDKNQITFYRTEYDALKKILPKGIYVGYDGLKLTIN